MSELEDFRRACDMKTWGGRVIAALLDHVAALEQREPQVSRNEPIATPATVERFRSRMFRFDAPMTWSWYGDVRATLGGMVDDKWCVDLPGGVRLNLTEIEYRALVDHNVRAGIWERQG